MSRSLDASTDWLSPDDGWDENAQSAAPSAGDGIDLAMILRRKWWILLGGVIGAVLAAVQYARTPPVYESTGQILIQEKERISPLETADSAAFIRDSGMHMDHSIVLASPKLVGRAIQEHQLDRLPSLANSANVLETLRRGLSVNKLRDSTGIFNIVYRGPSAEDAPEILRALIETYRDFLEVSDKSVSDEVVKFISDAQGKLDGQLTEQNARYLAKFKDTGLLLVKDGEMINVHMQRQQEIEVKRSEIRFRLSELNTQLQTIRDALKRGDSAETILLAM